MPLPFVVRSRDNNSFVFAALHWSGHALRVPQAKEVIQPYAIIAPVLDYPRILDVEGGPLSFLLEQDWQDLQARRAVLLLDFANEGPKFHLPIFESLREQLTRKGCPLNRVCFLSQNRLLGQDYERAFGANEIVFANFDYFVRLIALWLQDRRGKELFGDEVDFSSYRPMQAIDGPSYLAMCAAPRWQRVLLYRWLMLNGLLPWGLVSFHGIGPDNPKAQEIDINNPPTEVTRGFPDLVAGIDEWIPRKAIRFDSGRQYGNDLARNVDASAFERTSLSIVTESDFFFGPIQRVTEKLPKAAAMGHPFILVGPPHSMPLMRELGFDTFDSHIDHSYDSIEDNVARLKAIFSVIDVTLKRIERDREDWNRSVGAISRANIEHARSGGFLARLKESQDRELFLTLERLARAT